VQPGRQLQVATREEGAVAAQGVVVEAIGQPADDAGGGPRREQHAVGATDVHAVSGQGHGPPGERRPPGQTGHVGVGSTLQGVGQVDGRVVVQEDLGVDGKAGGLDALCDAPAVDEGTIDVGVGPRERPESDARILGLGPADVVVEDLPAVVVAQVGVARVEDAQAPSDGGEPVDRAAEGIGGGLLGGRHRHTDQRLGLGWRAAGDAAPTVLPPQPHGQGSRSGTVGSGTSVRVGGEADLRDVLTEHLDTARAGVPRHVDDLGQGLKRRIHACPPRRHRAYLSSGPTTTSWVAGRIQRPETPPKGL